eukprot:GFYU01002306.1.p1 GENE.GFYU01002306.1~~GFYU01002306.1.p1  ORF type:complete len:507 (+),score=88.52 GFYU01002306.1:47-1567(+)
MGEGALTEQLLPTPSSSSRDPRHTAASGANGTVATDGHVDVNGKALSAHLSAGKPTSVQRGGRLAVLDIVRGIIMILMAIDHASAIVGHVHGSEEWYAEKHYDEDPEDEIRFATRFVTHLCAPGFCVLMGIGMALFSRSRQRLGWTQNEITLYHLKRAALLICPVMIPGEMMPFSFGFKMQELVNPDVHSPFPHPPGVVFSVMTTILFSLSTAMFLSALAFHAAALLRAKFGRDHAGDSDSLIAPAHHHNNSRSVDDQNTIQRLIPSLPVAFLLTVAIGVFVLSDLVVRSVTKDDLTNMSPWLSLFFVPGVSVGSTVTFRIGYTVFPWVSMAIFGGLFADILRSKSSSAELAKVFSVTSAVLMTVFALLRSLRGFGNLVPIPDSDATVLDIFDVVKYPPSICFFTVTMSLNSLMAALICYGDHKQWIPYNHWFYQPARIFGVTPLFYYLMHLYVITILGLLTGAQDIPFGTIFAYWFSALVILYYPCKRYGQFKQSKPATSFWRFF